MAYDDNFSFLGKIGEIEDRDYEFFKPVTFSNVAVRLGSVVVAPIFYAVLSLMCAFELVYNILSFVFNGCQKEIFYDDEYGVSESFRDLLKGLAYVAFGSIINLVDFIGGLFNSCYSYNNELSSDTQSCFSFGR